MTCNRCGKNIIKGQKYHRTKRGPHHAECVKAYIAHVEDTRDDLSAEILRQRGVIAEKDATIERLEADYAAYREVLKRNKQGCQNILEFRKLSSDAWGQRDGYGGRYGALTREELEDVIAEIDTVLTNPAGAELLERLREAEEDVAFLKACNQTMAERISRLDEPWVDEHGESWTAPTAYAYAMVCKARDKHAARAKLAEEWLNKSNASNGRTIGLFAWLSQTRSKLSFNPRLDKWIVQRYDQTVGNVGQGGTPEQAILAAIAEYESLNAAHQPGEGGK